MSYNARIIEVFLSSPSDVQPERTLILSLADEWNRLRSRDTGCFISVLTWESVVAPALGSRAQQVVNDQVGHTYDVYLGLMWTRLGTPTGVSPSGTVEEFELALGRSRHGDQVRIAALFKKATVDPDAIDLNQLEGVRRFKERVASEGGFYREFSDENSLRSIVNLLFEQIARDRDTYEISIGEQAPPTSPVLRDAEPEREAEPLGLIELGEEFERQNEDFLLQLAMIAEKEVENSEVLSECVERVTNMTTYGTVNPEAAKEVVHTAAESLNRLADYLDSALEPLEIKIETMSALIQNDILIRLEFEDPVTSAGENIAGLQTLSSSIDVAVSQLDALIESTNSLPRLSNDIARAKGRLSKLRQRLRQLFIGFQDSINNSLLFFADRTAGRGVGSSMPAPTSQQVSSDESRPSRRRARRQTGKAKRKQ